MHLSHKDSADLVLLSVRLNIFRAVSNEPAYKPFVKLAGPRRILPPVILQRFLQNYYGLAVPKMLPGYFGHDEQELAHWA